MADAETFSGKHPSRRNGILTKFLFAIFPKLSPISDLSFHHWKRVIVSGLPRQIHDSRPCRDAASEREGEKLGVLRDGSRPEAAEAVNVVKESLSRRVQVPP